MNEYYEAAIIGGGPAGLTSGVYLMRAGIQTVLLERGILGGTAARTEHIENYPGFPAGISGTDLAALMVEQAKRFGLTIKEFFDVSTISPREGGGFVIAGEGGSAIEAAGIILATGTEWKQVGIPGEQEFVGRGVSYCATCDAMFFQDQDVAVIGGGDSALQEALTLANLCRRVWIVHRRDQLRAQKVLQERAFKQGRIEFLWNKVPVEITGTEAVEAVVLRDTLSGETQKLAVDGVFVFIGLGARTDFLGDLVDRDEGGFVRVDETLLSKTEGLFVAGDVRRKSLRQITTAVGDGALAAVNLEKYILEMR
jgi:thioredoxin reductase (NADPH)